LEQTTPPNRALCLTNKIFTCLLAGVPLLLSDTLAQRALAIELGIAATVVPLTNAAELAESVQRLLEPGQLMRRREVAWRLGHERFNWEHEQIKFLNTIRLALQAPVRAACR
jgi:glycosyltransferase involved in cell wall biosynthesis